VAKLSRINLQSSQLLERSAEGTYAPETVAWAQLEPGNFEVRYGFVDASPLRLALRKMNVGFKGEASVPKEKSVIGILADPRTRARWFGAKMDARSIFSSPARVELATSGAGSFYTISIDRHSIARDFARSPDALTLLDDLQQERLSHDPLLASRLRRLLHRSFSISHAPPRRSVSGTLIPLLASAIDRGEERVVESSKCLNRRLTAVRRCETYMRENVDATLTLLDLSQVSGMRSRSLINAFEAVTGYSPMDYLKRIRLNGVHRALQRAHRDAIRIIDVATDWGFWHMGHFTTDYRTMFGETPSQTLLR